MPELRGPYGAIGYKRDDLGFPAIEAKNLVDVAWACGWFHACDRLVQVQLMLAIANGRALALIGDTPVARYVDRMTRLHRFTDDLDEQVARFSRETRAILDAYAAGFNVGARKRGWPLLLRAAGIGPRPYRPHDLILIDRLVGWFGLNQLVEMATLITGELVATKTSPKALALLLGDAATADEIANAPVAAWPADFSAFVGSGVGGSNAIAVAGSRSATGGALLAADPHMEIGRIPPVLYAMHASYGSSEYLQGLHVPGIWYPSFGRTAHIGWTYTYGHVSSVDVRIVRCRRGEFFDGTTWRSLSHRTASVTIKKRPAETWTFWDCELGTMVGDAAQDAEISLPCTLWSGVRETFKDVNAGYALVHAKDVDAAIAANRGLSVFCLEAIVADSKGRIGSVLGGRMDARSETSRGVIPRSPDGRGVAPFDEATRPTVIDPPSGWIVSANARPTEPGGRSWAPMPESSARRDRLSSLISATERPGLDDLARSIFDACDAAATRLLAVWAPHLPDHPRAKQLVEWAAAQPGHTAEHFAQLTLWNALYERACRVLLRKHLGERRADQLIDELVGLTLFRYHLDDALALQHPDHLDTAGLKEVLTEAFPSALTDAASLTAKLPRTDRFKNAVFAGKLSWLLDSKAITNHGGPTTPNQVTAILLGQQQLVFGAAGRYLCDMSKPGGWYCISGGASERRLKIGYGKGLEDWAAGRFRPLGHPTGPAPSVR